MRFLHFADNSGCYESDPKHERLHKIRQIVDFLNQRRSEPSLDVLTNSYLHSRGVLVFSAIYQKHARFRIKVYDCCTSVGTLLYFMTYDGNTGRELAHFTNFLTTKISFSLLQPYLNNEHVLFTCSFLTPLLTCLVICCEITLGSFQVPWHIDSLIVAFTLYNKHVSYLFIIYPTLTVKWHTQLGFDCSKISSFW